MSKIPADKHRLSSLKLACPCGKHDSSRETSSVLRHDICYSCVAVLTLSPRRTGTMSKPHPCSISAKLARPLSPGPKEQVSTSIWHVWASWQLGFFCLFSVKVKTCMFRWRCNITVRCNSDTDTSNGLGCVSLRGVWCRDARHAAFVSSYMVFTNASGDFYVTHLRFSCCCIELKYSTWFNLAYLAQK